MSDRDAALDDLRRARQVADAVLYEGYLLFPYRASATKNRFRWQWGVVVPEEQHALGHAEDAEVTCQVLVRSRTAPTDDPRVEVVARFLRLRHRQMVDAEGVDVERLEVAGEPIPTWDEGLEHETPPLPVALRPRAADADDHLLHVIELGSDREVEVYPGVGAALRTTEPLRAEARLTLQPLDEQVSALTVTIANTTAWSQPQARRDEVLRHSLVGVHVLLRARGGAEIASAIDPPGWAAPWARTRRSRGLHPVLAGGPIPPEPLGADPQAGTLALALPIILSDFPEIAPESLGQSFDATEVDELLALCVLGLTDAEQAEARATDPRAAALLDRTAELSPAMVDRLHGTIRSRSAATVQKGAELDLEPEVRLDPEAAVALGVGQASPTRLRVGRTHVEVGSRVRLRPRRRADAQDLFLDGRLARVERIVTTDDGEPYVAVTVEGDPAADLHRWYGRFHYFGRDEIDVEEDV